MISAEDMSLRDWFAGMALQGLLTDHNIDEGSENIAKAAYILADAMLAERKGNK